MLDRRSETWINLKARIRSQIEKLRDDLEVRGSDAEHLRGEISALRWVIKEVEPDAPISEPTGTNYMQAREPEQS